MLCQYQEGNFIRIYSLIIKVLQENMIDNGLFFLNNKIKKIY